MDTKEIKVGDYIRGFKYDCGEYMIYRMNVLIGEIAKVIKVEEDIIFVKFSNGKTWWYPKHQAIEHLCNDDMKEFEKGLDANAKDILKSTPFHKPDFSHLKDNINPNHYKSKSKETIERLQDNLTQGEFKGYLKGNILKYLDRYEHKNGVEDLSKMQWYLNKLIEIES
jgi:hypothetical protein